MGRPFGPGGEGRITYVSAPGRRMDYGAWTLVRGFPRMGLTECATRACTSSDAHARENRDHRAPGRVDREPAAAAGFQPRSLDGSGNNLAHPAWGQAGTPYPRLAPPRYADATGAQMPGPAPRYVSNRVFNDIGQNLFSENGIVSQWGWAWGQFMDHDLRACATRRRRRALRCRSTPSDPLESFTQRPRQDPVRTRRRRAGHRHEPPTRAQQINTRQLATSTPRRVYGGTAGRLEWLRGAGDGDMPTTSLAARARRTCRARTPRERRGRAAMAT